MIDTANRDPFAELGALLQERREGLPSSVAPITDQERAEMFARQFSGEHIW